MSFGALSVPAIRALSHGARLARIWMNTGEGGLSPYHLEGGCDIVFQIGTAKFGVRKPEGGFDDEQLKAITAHENVKMFEIKLSQGAKPGKGGILPAVKVTPEIAKIRGIPVGVAAISPNRHPEISNLDDLLAMITHVRRVTEKPKAVRVANYAKNMTKEIGIIAQSCGVAEPRQLTRHHARMVDGCGGSISLAALYDSKSASQPSSELNLKNIN